MIFNTGDNLVLNKNKKSNLNKYYETLSNINGKKLRKLIYIYNEMNIIQWYHAINK